MGSGAIRDVSLVVQTDEVTHTPRPNASLALPSDTLIFPPPAIPQGAVPPSGSLSGLAKGASLVDRSR